METNTCGFPNVGDQPAPVQITASENWFQLIFSGFSETIELKCLIEFGQYECLDEEKTVEDADGRTYTSQIIVSGTFENVEKGDLHYQYSIEYPDSSCEVYRKASLVFVSP